MKKTNQQNLALQKILTNIKESIGIGLFSNEAVAAGYFAQVAISTDVIIDKSVARCWIHLANAGTSFRGCYFRTCFAVVF